MTPRHFAYLATVAGLQIQNLFAAADAESSRKAPFLEMLKMEVVGLAPILIIMSGVVVFFGWYFRRQMKSPEYRTHLEHEARHRQHMERVEQTLERIAGALERKEKERD